MKFEEVDRLRLLEYLLYTCGGIIILGSISAVFDKDDTYSVQNISARFYHTRYLFYLFITLFMIMSLLFFLLLKVELIMKI